MCSKFIIWVKEAESNDWGNYIIYTSSTFSSIFKAEALKAQKIYENADLCRMTVNTNDIISVKEYEIVFSFIANN